MELSSAKSYMIHDEMIPYILSTFFRKVLYATMSKTNFAIWRWISKRIGLKPVSENSKDMSVCKWNRTVSIYFIMISIDLSMLSWIIMVSYFFKHKLCNRVKNILQARSTQNTWLKFIPKNYWNVNKYRKLLIPALSRRHRHIEITTIEYYRKDTATNHLIAINRSYLINSQYLENWTISQIYIQFCNHKSGIPLLPYVYAWHPW